MSTTPNSSNVVRLGIVQMSCVADREVNVANALQQVAQLAAQGAQIVCLQELFAGQYPCQAEDHRKFDEAESIPGPTSRALAATAEKCGVVIVGSLFERRAPGVYHNSAVIFDADGSFLGSYRKMHIPDDPLYYEKFYFTPGDLGFRTFATCHGKIGVGICWDQWFPEAARLMALSGSQIVLYPTAIGWLPDEKQTFGAGQFDAWQTVMRSHAITNGVFVAAANRVGTEDNLEFWGGSFAVDPTGVILAQASQQNEQTILVECNLAQVDATRTHWPFLRDRRIDAYGGLLKRYLDDDGATATA